MKTMLITLILITATLCQADQVVFDDNFTQAASDAYLDDVAELPGRATFLTEPGVDGRVLKLTGPVSFKSVPVDHQVKYQLTFRGRQEGVEPLEENPRLAEMILNSRSFLPVGELKFFDSVGIETGVRLPRLAMAFGRWHEYRWVFYPPMNAVTMKWHIHTGAAGNSMYMANVKLAPAPDEGAININPTFSYGPYNYSGWAAFNVYGGPGRLHEIEDGKVVLDTGFHAWTTTFPLGTPGTYRIHVKTSSYVRNNTVFLIFLGADGKEVGRFGERPGRSRKEIDVNMVEAKEYTWHFVLPKHVERGYFLVYHNMLERLELTRIGDEEMYNEVAR